MKSIDLDALGLLSKRTRKSVRFGTVDAESIITDGHLDDGLDELPRANLEFDLGLSGAEPIDFLAPLSYRIRYGGHDSELFSGAVMSAAVEGQKLRVQGQGAPGLTELLMNGMVVENAPPPEIVHAAARSAGFPEDKLMIDGLAERPSEVFEVVAPIKHVSVDRTEKVGGAHLVPIGEGRAAISGFAIDESTELKREFEDADSYFVSVVRSNLLYDAEEQGLASIDRSLAWLVVRSRFGLATLPSGRAQAFSRRDFLTSPVRGSVVIVRGLLTKRRWLRRPENLLANATWRIGPGSSFASPQLPDAMPVSDQQALLALRRATTERDPLATTQALWQAIESYAAGSRVKRLFSRSAKKSIRALMPDDLTPVQRDKLEHVIDNLNDAPLMARLEVQLKRDGVPMTKGELDLLYRLREARNDTVHGRHVGDLPDREELDYGTSLVARMLVYRIERLRSNDLSETLR